MFLHKLSIQYPLSRLPLGNAAVHCQFLYIAVGLGLIHAAGFYQEPFGPVHQAYLRHLLLQRKALSLHSP